jgi:F-type H+-transporting ATPase subunit a
MEHHVTWLTLFVNKYLGPYALALLDFLRIHPESRQTPIPEYVVMSWMVFVLAAVFVLWLKGRLSINRPGASQQVVEMLITNPLGFGIGDLLDQNVGHGGRKYMAMVGSVAIFVLLANMLGAIPGLSSPTGHPSVPLACALITFLYFNWQGIRAHGVGGYLKHFAGPVWWMSWLIFPVEIISTMARILSLTVRLWANIFSSELIYITILGLFVKPTIYFWPKLPSIGAIIAVLIFPVLGAIAPVAFIGLHFFVAIVQALVFTILPTIYLGLAVAEEH